VAVLLIDFEATGIDPKQVRILEIGAMVTDDSFNPTGAQLSQLVWESGYPALTDEVKAVTGLTEDLLVSEGIPLFQAMSKLGNLITEDVKYAIAFNRAYDEVLYKEECNRLDGGNGGMAKLYASVPWLCAMIDIETNYKFKSWRLAHLALEYKVPVDPNKLHRAINDVELMRCMLKAIGTTPQEMQAYQNVPWVYVCAVTRPPWEDKGASTDAAKLRGYNWQSAKGDPSGLTFEKRWVKRIKEKDFEKEEKEAPFTVRIIK
jgi:DNA polymerase III epsilon subunit-like protein